MSDSPRIYVKPASPELIVNDPDTVGMLPIPPEGKWVTENSYWSRLLRDGDVVKTDPPAAPVAPASASKKAKDQP